MELYNLPAGHFQVLYNIAINRQNSESGKEQMEAEAMEDALEEVM